MGKGLSGSPVVLTQVFLHRTNEKKRKKKKKALDQSVASGNAPYSPEELEAMWSLLAEQLQCAVLQVSSCRNLLLSLVP